MNENTITPQKDSVKVAVPFIVTVTLVFGFFLGMVVFGLVNSINQTNSSSQTNTEDTNKGLYLNSSLLEEIYNQIQERYIGAVPSDEKVTENLAKGMIQSLNDPYASYLTSDEASKYMDSRDPDFEGIGVTLRFNGEYTEVETVLASFPAEKAGVLSGDMITEVDGEKMTKVEPPVVATKIRGEGGTTVKLKILRSENGGYVEKEFSIVREKIDVDNITYKNEGDGVFRISISQFIDVSPTALNESWDKVVDQVLAENPNPKGVIVDLRGNPGGYVYSVRYIIEEFLKKNKIMMMEETKNSSRITYKDVRTGKLEDVPLVVLVNEGSASASEIFAAAIQDNNRGKIVGAKTIGKGVEQDVIDNLPGGGMLILPFQKWLTPNGNNISKDSPITPDFEVEFNVELRNKERRDTQLEKAKELILTGN